jgi:DNA modification methylase
MELGRRFAGMELDSDYFAAAQARLAAVAACRKEHAT